jgi:ribosomal protein S27E
MYTMFDGLLLANVFMAVVSIVLFCLIFRKAGYSWALGLLMLVPLVNIVVFVHLAVGRWPLEKRFDRARAKLEELGHPVEATSPPAEEAGFIDFLCRHCGEHLRIHTASGGKTVPCPYCGAELKVPRPGKVPLRERIRSAVQRARGRRRSI